MSDIKKEVLAALYKRTMQDPIEGKDWKMCGKAIEVIQAQDAEIESLLKSSGNSFDVAESVCQTLEENIIDETTALRNIKQAEDIVAVAAALESIPHIRNDLLRAEKLLLQTIDIMERVTTSDR